MPDRDRSSTAATVNNWVQTGGIVLAGCWALYVFGYKEWYLPRHEISVLELRAAIEPLGVGSVGDEGGPAQAFLLRVSATNPSRRRVQIASAFAEVFGDRVCAKEIGVETLEASVEETLDSYEGMVGRFFVDRTSERVFVTRLFSGQSLEPGETARAVRLFHLPKDRFDQLEALVFALSGPTAHELTIGHRLHEDVIEWKLLRDGGTEHLWGSREFNEVALDEQLGKSTANAVLSLWRPIRE